MKTEKPSVLIIVENLPVPIDRRVWQEARALRDAGYDVSVICPKKGMFSASHERLEGIEVFRHSLPEASGSIGYVVEYGWALAAEFTLALRIYARKRFRILHAANPPDTIFLIALFFRLFGVRFVFDHHDLNPELFEAKFGKKSGFLYRLVCLTERRSYRTAAVSIATNESYREVAIKRGGMNPERVFLVRSTPDLARMKPVAPQPGLRRGRRYLVAYLGVMGPQEGVPLLLEAAREIVLQRGPEMAHFVLIGGGTEAARLRSLAGELGLNSVVEFTGRIPDGELAVYLSTADVCVAPDPKNPMNDKSTMNKILEYMAFGRPTVLFDLAEGRRSAGEAALYAQSNDAADLARQIMTLLDSEPLRKKLGGEGLSRIAGPLNWELQKEALLAAYEMALAKRG